MRATDSAAVLLVDSVRAPLEAPALVGAKITCKVTLAPVLTEIGNGVVPNLYPAPLRLADSIVASPFPVFVTVKDCAVDFPTVTLPKESDVGLTLHAAVAGFDAAGAGDDAPAAADVCVAAAVVAVGIPAQPSVSKSQLHEIRSRTRAVARTHAPFGHDGAAHPE